MYFWVLWALFQAIQAQQQALQYRCHEGIQDLRVNSDLTAHTLFITWTEKCTFGSISEGLVYEVQVLRIGPNKQEEVAHDDTINVRIEKVPWTHHWNWTSPIPLECSTHRVRVRSRFQQWTSNWSQEIIPGKEGNQVYPEDQVRAVGSNMTFCCILKENQMFHKFLYDGVVTESVQINPWIYTTTIKLNPSIHRGSNVECILKNNLTNSNLGAVVHVGRPPGDNNLRCETDMVNVLCIWNKNSQGNFYEDKKTYTLNNWSCPTGSGKTSGHCKIHEPKAWGERNWTVVVKNRLGIVKLVDMVDLRHRIHLQDPQQLERVAVYARSANIMWKWTPKEYETLLIRCQIQLNFDTQSKQRNYSGLGLSRLMLNDLLPNTQYSVTVRCGSEENFWKWSSWSSPLNFRTQEDNPEALDLWILMDENTASHILWKPLAVSQSHGNITKYVVTWQSPTGRQEQRLNALHTRYSLPLELRNISHTIAVTVTAVNSAGPSPPATIVLPKIQKYNIPTSRIYGSNGSFDLSWPSSIDATCGYVVDWCSVTGDCGHDVGWMKVPAGQTSARIQSANFAAGRRYRLSIYACHSLAPELIKRMEGYVEEDNRVEYVHNLKISQNGEKAVLTWEVIPEEDRTGFILGYKIFCQKCIPPVVNLTDPSVRSYTSEDLTPGFYTFEVKAYTLSWVESTGKNYSINMSPLENEEFIMFFIMGIVILLIFFMAMCFWKREWIKMMICPEIPKPKLSYDWAPPQVTLDVKACPHSLLHIVDKQEKIDDLIEDRGNVQDFYPTDTDYSSLPVLNYYKQEPSKEPWKFPSSTLSAVSPLATLCSNESTSVDLIYTRVKSVSSYVTVPFGLDVFPKVDPLPSPSGSDTPLLDTPGSYVPQGARKLDNIVSSTQCLLTSCENQADFSPSHSFQSSYKEIPVCCHTISNPTYCATFSSHPLGASGSAP